MSTSEIIILFIELAQKYDWSKLQRPLPEDEVKILFALVNIAGFRPTGVNLGYVMGQLHDHNGKTKEMSAFQINTFSPYNVKCHLHHIDNLATKWLDNALCFASKQTDREVCIRVIQSELEKDIQLKNFFER